MKEVFPAYYPLTEDDFSKLWDECLFVFDTNVLLNLYRYKTETHDQLFDIFDKIKESLWLPHQVALEFHEERMPVIKSLMNAYEKIERTIEENYTKIKNELKSYKERHPIIDVDEIVRVLDENYKSIRAELENKKKTHPNWTTRDEIKERIDVLFYEKVGEPYPQERLEDIYKRGELRYSLKIPPGYEDRTEKKELPYRKFGDLILWLQLIDKAKHIHKPIIFVTDDTKKDWWSKDGTPRSELIQEFFLGTGSAFIGHRLRNIKYISSFDFYKMRT